MVVYKADFDKYYNYNDAPLACKNCGHQYFRISAFCWICDNCEAKNDPDMERNEKYRQLAKQRREEAARKRGKRRKSKKDIEDEINMNL